MLSYRHAFHAGNHADILKHASLCLILQSLQKKDKPFTLIDTHAGAGLYRLDSEWALKTGENQKGIIKLLNAFNKNPASFPPELQNYINLCQGFYSQNCYAGSPVIMQKHLRSGDKLVLLEMHNNEVEILRSNIEETGANATILHQNSFEAIKAITPPPIKRGLLLMDPSYEIDSDYTNAFEALALARKRWNVGILCLWYPLLKHRQTELAMLKSSLRELAAENQNNFVQAELLVASPENETGLYGSGMAIINAPWHFNEEMANILPFLGEMLADANQININETFNLIADIY